MNFSASIKPNILYEDNHMLVAVKPSGVLSQADHTGDLDMLTLIKDYLKTKYQKSGNVYLGLLHRLDRPVSGVMVFAKTSKCASRISAQIRDRTVEKKYRAIVYGLVEPKKGTLKQYVEKDHKMNKAYAPQSTQGKEAILKYQRVGSAHVKMHGKEVLLSLLDVYLITGRAHQIRFQLSDLGHPLLGDIKYNSIDRYQGDICLESYYLELNHPISNERMIFNIPIKNEYPWNAFLIH